jgi:hypothetical protein
VYCPVPNIAGAGLVCCELPNPKVEVEGVDCPNPKRGVELEEDPKVVVEGVDCPNPKTGVELEDDPKAGVEVVPKLNDLSIFYLNLHLFSFVNHKTI